MNLNKRIHTSTDYAPVEIHFNLPSKSIDKLNFDIFNKFIEARKKCFHLLNKSYEVNNMVKIKMNKSPFLTPEQKFQNRKKNIYD